MQPLMGRPWFRRRRLGFGWRPVSWQGWAVTLVAVALVIAVLAVLHASPERIPLVLVVVAVYAVVALLTGGRRAEPATAASVPLREAPAVEGLPRVEQPTARRPGPATSNPPALVVERL